MQFIFLSWAEELISVEVNHVVRHLGNPYFCLPGELINEAFVLINGEKGCNEDFSGCYILCHVVNVQNACRAHRPDRINCFDEVNPVFVLFIQ